MRAMIMLAILFHAGATWAQRDSGGETSEAVASIEDWALEDDDYRRAFLWSLNDILNRDHLTSYYQLGFGPFGTGRNVICVQFQTEDLRDHFLDLAFDLVASAPHGRFSVEPLWTCPLL